MKHRYYFGLIALLFACSVFENEQGELTGEFIGSDLEINNGHFESVYVFPVDEDVAAVIDWIPLSTEENEIKAGSARRIAKSDIMGFKEDGKVIVYYWFEPQEEIFNIVLD